MKHTPSQLKYFLWSSIGNFLLAAAQSFFRSLPSAILLFSSITNSQVRTSSLSFTSSHLILIQANIVPVIATNHTVTIAAELVRQSRVCTVLIKRSLL